jgi:hypothetical protein
MKRSGSRSSRTIFNLLLHLGHRSKSEGGYIIVVVAGLIVAISGLLLTSELFSRVDSNSTKSSGNSAAGFYAAEAGLNLRAKDIRGRFSGYNIPSGTSPADWTECRDGGGSSSGDFECNDSFTVQDYLSPNDTSKRVRVTTYVTDVNPKDTSGNPVPTPITINTGEQFAGLNAQEYRYDVNSVAYDRVSGQPSAIAGIRFKSRLVPLFQFAAFYQNDLDFSNPAPMNLNGPIHTNADLYMNTSSGNTITISGQMTSAGNMYRGEKATSSCNTGFQVIDPSSLREVPCGSGTTQLTTSNLTNWNGNIKPNIPVLTIPSPAVLNSQAGSEYWDKADLRIALRLNPTNRAFSSIDILNADGSTNATATSTLNSSTCLPSGTSATNPSTTSLAATATATATTITVGNASIFNPGDPIQISAITNSNANNNLTSTNTNNVVFIVQNIVGNVITLTRPLGRAITNTTGVTVTRPVVWYSNTFYNYREKGGATQSSTLDQGRLIRMLNVDTQRIMTCASSLMGKTLTDDTDGGLVWFFTVKSSNSTALADATTNVTATPTAGAPNGYGIRIYNGAYLKSLSSSDTIKGLTVATDQAVYIRGDYNCSGSVSDPDPASTTRAEANTSCPSTSQTKNKRPAAILADSLNILSNAWTLSDVGSCRAYDSQTTPTTCSTRTRISTGNAPGVPGVNSTDRRASDTTINAAFLSGVDITGGVNGNGPNNGPPGGGLNNYPRLHEDWSTPRSDSGFVSRILTYRGSMVSLGLALRVNGPFCGSGSSSPLVCNIYNPPTRNWKYDTDFNNAANLPPLTPRFVYLRQERFSRDYTRTSFLPFLTSPFASFFPANFVATLPTFTGGRFLF